MTGFGCRTVGWWFSAWFWFWLLRALGQLDDNGQTDMGVWRAFVAGMAHMGTEHGMAGMGMATWHVVVAWRDAEVTCTLPAPFCVLLCSACHHALLRMALHTPATPAACSSSLLLPGRPAAC